MSTVPVIFLLFVAAYANRFRQGHQYASAIKPDPSEQCSIELNSTAAIAMGTNADNHFNAAPQRKFRFHPHAHFAIEWILNPLSRDRFRLRRNHQFTAAPKDEVENPITATEHHLGTGQDSQGDGAVADEGGRRAGEEEDEDTDRVDFAVDENRSSIITSLQSPMSRSRSWSVSGGRKYTRGIKRSSSVAVLQEISNQDIPESLAI